MLRNEKALPELLQIIIDELYKLSTFITFLCLYFVFVSDDGDVRLTTFLKCAPIIALGIYVITKGFKCTEEYSYSQMVLGGLVFSSFADMLLNLDYFPHGMAVFGIAQMFYISAFELQPWKISIGIPLYLIAAGVTMYIFSALDIVIKIGLPIYAFLLTTMCWRCIVRATVKNDILATVGAVGSVLFVISDSLISVTMFVVPIPKARILVMTTYYAAQFCIALSTLNDVLKPKKGKGSKKLSRSLEIKTK